MSQTIPIILTAGPVPPGFAAADINQLMQAIATYISGAIRTDVTFIPRVLNDPATNISPIIFNVSQNIFKVWDISSGSYIAITEFQLGDVKNSFVGTDDIVHGWVLLDGRAIAAITGITGLQQQTLNNLFNGGSPGGTLPTVKPANIVGLPADGSFSGIVWPPSINPVVTPDAGTFGGLFFSDPVAATEAREFANDTEILRGSVQDSFDVTKQIQAQAEFTLNALNAPATTPMHALVFCGYPGP